MHASQHSGETPISDSSLLFVDLYSIHWLDIAVVYLQ